jgi:hypothetical protein
MTPGQAINLATMLLDPHVIGTAFYYGLRSNHPGIEMHDPERMPQISVKLKKLLTPRYAIPLVVFAVFVSLLNQTSLYQRLNALPPDRTELDAISNTQVFIERGNTIVVRLTISAIASITLRNLANGLRLWVSRSVVFLRSVRNSWLFMGCPLSDRRKPGWMGVISVNIRNDRFEHVGSQGITGDKGERTPG